MSNKNKTDELEISKLKGHHEKREEKAHKMGKNIYKSYI